MFRKLQQKFVLLTTGISIIVMLLIAISINIVNYSSVISRSDEILNILTVGSLMDKEEFNSKHSFPRELAYTTRFFSVFTNEDGEVDVVDTKNISFISSDKAIEYVDIVKESDNTLGSIENFRYIITENDIGHTYIFLDIEQELIGFERYMLYSVIIVFGAVVAIFILSLLLSKKAVSPIVESFERQKSFITNVSHEFKTPLAIIKADCDVIEIDNGEGEWTDSIKTQISRLDTLVENLISLTKLEEKDVMIKTDFSLSDAVSDTINEFSPALKNSDRNLDLDIKQNISYNGDETLIRRLITAVTENAIKYSLPQTSLKISLNTSGNKKIFKIENSCESIEVGKHNDWFERFYRGNKSRNSQTKGFGIGLSIAKSICDLHGAKIYAESKTGKDTLITIVF